MAPLPRILVVDPIGHLGGIVKAGMTMLNRPHVMVEVPTIQEAIDEISRSSLDLMVTALFLGENSPNGIDLAERAIREQAGTPIVIMADEFDAPPDASRLEGKPFQYLTYPPGEDFFRALRVGLDGEDVVQAQKGSASEFDIGPVPNVDIESIGQILHQHMIEFGAIGVMFCDRFGRILIEDGNISYIDKSMIGGAIGPFFARATKVAPQVGGPGWSMIHYDGDRYDIYAIGLGYHHFMLLLFEGDNRAAMGEVSRFRRRGIEEYIDLIGPQAWTFEEVVKETFDADDETEVVEKRSTVSMPAVSVEEEEYEPEPVEDEPFLDPVGDLDVDLLFSDDIADDNLDDLFGGGSDEIESEFFSLTGEEGVSFDEAQDMGLLGE